MVDIKFKITIMEKNGKCVLGYKEGDQFFFNGLNTPAHEFCGGSYHVLFPLIVALRFGAVFPFAEKKDTMIAVCPDKGIIKYKIEKISE